MILAALLAVVEIDRVDFDNADSRLNGAYQALLANLDPRDVSTARASQRGWLASRNRRCGFEVKNACAFQATQRRTITIESQLSSTQRYRSITDSQLFRLDRVMDEQCRGTSQDADGAVCTRRDEVVDVLQRRGWCWGPDASDEANRRWMRVGRFCTNP